MKIVLKNERPISWNKFYSGMHWKDRKEEADRVHMLVWLELHGYQPETAVNPKMFKKKVDIRIVVYFKNRPQDPDNICSKLYIDGLIGNVIENDTRQFVRRVTTQSEIDKDNPRVEIELDTI